MPPSRPVRPAHALALTSLLLLVPLVRSAASVGSAEPGPAPAPEGVWLLPGRAVTAEIDPDADYPLFRVSVPARATSLLVRTRGASDDVDLYCAFESPPEPDEYYWGISGEGTWIDEEILVDLTSDYSLEPGVWYFAVTPGPGASWEDVITCEIVAELVVPERRPLELGVVHEGVLERASGMRAAFELSPESASAAAAGPLRVEVFSPFADIDLLVGPAAPELTHSSPLRVEDSTLGYEALTVDAGQVETGVAFHVFGFPESEGRTRVPFTIAVTHAEESAPRLIPPSTQPDAAAIEGPYARPIAATVSVFGPLGDGSGVVVSPRGHVITNAHVVVGAEHPTYADTPVVAGFTTDPRLPPVPVFELELLDYRPDVDLALLRIRRGTDGAELGRSTRFPHLELAPRAGVALGEPLVCIGYPSNGGRGTMVSVTLTRGTLSGYTHEPEGLLLKTDMDLHAGVSGGACLDGEGRLVGFPVGGITNDDETGEVGLILPAELVPQAWLARLAE